MGDRCYLQAEFHPDDYRNLLAEIPQCNYIDDDYMPAFLRPFEKPPEASAWMLNEEKGHIYVEWSDVNYGAYDDFERLARVGIRFSVWHGAGVDYSPGAYVSCGDGKFHVAKTSWDHDAPVVELDDNALTNKIQLGHARRFIKAREKLRGQFKAKAQEYASEQQGSPPLDQ